MRVSAVVVGESTQDMVKVIFAQQPQREEAFYRYLRHLVGQPDYLPLSEEEKYFDTLLAGLCVGYAAERHAGTKKQVCTCVGNGFTDGSRSHHRTQSRRFRGWLSRASQFDIHNWLKYRELDDRGKEFCYRISLSITAIQMACSRYWQTSPGCTRKPLLITSIQCLTL